MNAAADHDRLDPALRAESERLLWRYVVEVVEAFDLCPWARRARLDGEVRVEITTPAAMLEAAARIAGDPKAVMGMVVMPRADLDPTALRRLRDVLLASPLARTIAAADFHPDATADLTTAARAVPWLRRSPDPTLQVVRHAVLASFHRPPSPPVITEQLAMLKDIPIHVKNTVSDDVADRNLVTARADADEIAAAVTAILDDRDRSYARLDAHAAAAALRASSR